MIDLGQVVQDFKVSGDNEFIVATFMLGGSNMGVARVKLAATGSHSLTSSKPVGIQVYGYGSYTSYQYPGGLNLRSIAPPPPK